jgi:hypothetical protein
MSQDQNNPQLYSALKVSWQRERATWDSIAQFVGITVDTNYMDNGGMSSQTKGKDLDVYIDDPTAALSVNQSGDYLMGIMWGTGDQAFDIVPSRYVTALVSKAEVEKFYKYATDTALYHMNNPQAGFSTAMRPYTYDQMSFGTSGVGCFLNKAFLQRTEENALIFRNYGVDNTMIDEGKSGQPEIVATTYQWKVNRIISEFCFTDGDADDKKVLKMPRAIQDAYKSGNYNQVFKLIFMVYPRADYDMKLKGKRGARYKGSWFLDDVGGEKPFYEEDFAERPIAMARAIKVRGEVYGRASGTMLMSTIRSVNFMVGTAIEIVEKMSNPSLGLWNNAIFGDSVLDSSPNGLTIFNQALAQSAGGSPAFPLYDVGNPEPILKFLVPYLNEKITTGFKVDILLDFSSATEMTATESLQRYAIRGKSLAGFLLQQKNEFLVPTVKRVVSLLMGIGELGTRPNNKDVVKQLRQIGEDQRIIPDAVLQVMEQGLPWYDLKFNNELEKLTRTEAVQNLIQIIQAITAIAALYPEIIAAVNWYKLLSDINENLDANNQILIGEKKFAEQVAKAAEQRKQMMMLQAGEMGSKANANMAKSNRDNAEAKSVGSTTGQ